MKNYTLMEFAELTKISFHTLKTQVNRDLTKPANKKRYPGAFKSECCGKWMMPEIYLKKFGNKC